MESTTKILADAILATPSGILEQEILRRLVSHNENVTIKAEDDFLSEQKLCGEKIDGNQCIKLLDACIDGSIGNCNIQWMQLNWGAGIDWENMDYGAASKLAKKLHLDTDTVDTVVARLSAGVPDKTASESLKMSLQAIKNRISPSPLNTKPIASSVEGINVMPRTSVVSMSKMNMTGGGKSSVGQKCSYANFIRCLDNVKNNIYMRGGSGSEHAAILRSGLSELQELLQNKNKTIHKDDLVRINDLIDILERTEKRLNVLGSNIWALNSALKENSINISDDKKDITLKIIEELVEETTKVKQSSMNKTSNILEIFEKLDIIAKKIDSMK
jgi:hypothetical protein